MRPIIILDPQTRHLLQQMLCGLSTVSAQSPQVWAPPTDVFEVDDAIIVRMEIAGVRAEDIQIQAMDSMVIVSGQRSDAAKGLKRRISLMEMAFGPFERVIALPAAIQADRAHARYDAGILEIQLPKASQRQSQTIGVRIHLG